MYLAIGFACPNAPDTLKNDIMRFFEQK